MNQVWYAIAGMLVLRRELQMVINYRHPGLVDRSQQKVLIITSKGIDYWNFLMTKLGGFSDDQLRKRLSELEEELDFELTKLYERY
jgi:hypothetical protein